MSIEQSVSPLEYVPNPVPFTLESALHPVTKQPLRVLHVGNIANNAFNNASAQHRWGVDAEVICFDYYHIMGCPEWEEADFEGDYGDPFFPSWHRVNLQGYERPVWFAQGRAFACVSYLLARRHHDHPRERFWWQVMNLERRPDLMGYAKHANSRRRGLHIRRIRINHAQARAKVKSQLRRGVNLIRDIDRGRFPILKSVYHQGKGILAWRRRNLRIHRTKKIPVIDVSHHQYYQGLIDTFAATFPDRPDQLTLADIEFYLASPLIPMFHKLFAEYDLIHAYSTDPIYPLLLDHRPYVAFEHGTIRHIPFEDSPRGRLTALAYHLADEVVITNSDNLEAAQKLKLDNYTFIPHPMNEYWNRTGVGAHLREELQRQFGTDFVIFHPARHYWSRDPLAEQKANHLLIEGFARFIQEVAPRALAIFVEWGTSVDDSKTLLEALGCQSNVKWVEPMNRAAMARYIDASDVVADQFFLGAFGGIPPQALSFGKPTLLKFDAGMHQWCFEEMPPLINVDSADSIFEELKRLYTDHAYYEQIVHASLDWYPRYHSNRAVTEKTLALYQHALQKNRDTS